MPGIEKPHEFEPVPGQDGMCARCTEGPDAAIHTPATFPAGQRIQVELDAETTREVGALLTSYLERLNEAVERMDQIIRRHEALELHGTLPRDRLELIGRAIALGIIGDEQNAREQLTELTRIPPPRG